MSSLPSNVQALQEICRDQSHEIDGLKTRLSELEEMLRLLRYQRFGRSSEKMNLDNMTLLFDEQQAIAASEEKKDEDCKTEIKPHKRSKARREIPQHLPREDVVLDIEDKTCKSCNQELHKVSEKVTEKIEIVPAKAVVKRYIRPTYSCRCCEAMTTHSMPYHPIPKCSVTPATIAHIIISKYLDGLPLYRQEQMYKRQGIDLSRDMMASWINTLAEQAKPLKTALHQNILSHDRMGLDETSLQVNKEKGREAHQKSFMIVQTRDGPIGQRVALFHYEKSRSTETIRPYIEGFKGALNTDGLTVYQSLTASMPAISHGGCWTHVRRKFMEAVKGNRKDKSSTAAQFIELIGQLFHLEKQGNHDEERLSLRQEKSTAVIGEIEELLNRKITSVPRKSLTGKAVHYLNGQWTSLVRFLDDPRLAIHNNFTENQIRPFVLGRKNWIFADTVAGAEASATFYSLLTTAKLNELDPYDYLARVFRQPMSTDTTDLLPFR